MRRYYNAIPSEYIGIDPGVTTGIALFSLHRQQGKYLSYGHQFNSFPDATALDYILEKIKPVHDHRTCVCIEIPPIRGEPEQMARFFGWLRLLQGKGFTPCIISPGEWKPVATARNWKVIGANSHHEWDAYNIIRFYLWRTRKIEIFQDARDFPQFGG
jgi:hypothetical protein